MLFEPPNYLTLDKFLALFNTASLHLHYLKYLPLPDLTKQQDFPSDFTPV